MAVSGGMWPLDVIFNKAFGIQCPINTNTQIKLVWFNGMIDLTFSTKMAWVEQRKQSFNSQKKKKLPLNNQLEIEML